MNEKREAIKIESEKQRNTERDTGKERGKEGLLEVSVFALG